VGGLWDVGDTVPQAADAFASINSFSTGFVNPVAMSTIRHDLPTALPVSPTGQTVQMRTAQAAFFRAAMGDVQAAVPQQPRATSATASEAETPRVPRPGQLLDIRV